MKDTNRRTIIKVLAAAGLTPLSANTAACSKKSIVRSGPAKNIKLKNRAETLVLGAGLAGLNCAQNLESQGQEVVVLEARGQAGGRTRSELHDGITLNMGGIEIGDGYRRLLQRCSEHNINLYSPMATSRQTTLLVNNQLVEQSAWATSAQNSLPEALKSVLPSHLHRTLRGTTSPLQSVSDWLDTDMAKFDISESEFLKSRGANDEVLSLINQTGNFNDVDTISALHILRAVAYFRFRSSRKTLRISGGNQTLAMKMAAQLNRVHFNTQAKKIVESDSGVQVTCSDNSVWQADRLVIAIPFSVLRTLDLQAPLNHQQRIAIDTLPYTKISKLVLRVDKPFWEEDDLPANMWCDNLLERGFLSQSESGQPIYTIFVNGSGAMLLDGMNDMDASQHLLQLLHTARPSTRGKVSALAYYSWGKDPFARGAYHAFAPGQIAQFANPMTKPTARIHFAGEHCARTEPGMEGALESGELAANQLLENSLS